MLKLAFRVILVYLLLSTPVYAAQKVDIESLRTGVITSTVPVSTSAIALPATALRGRKVIVITNTSSTTIYIGDSSVTTANGLPLIENQSFAADITDAIVLYGIAGSGSNDVRVLELQ